jgi:minimal PKS acyl carrier protein
MSVFTLDELRTIMRQSAGAWEGAEHDADVADTCYSDLGYDSLALLEIAGKIEQTQGVQVPEDLVVCTATPAATVAAVNQLLAPVVGSV